MNHLRIHRPRRASQLSECGGAGTGCGWCVPYLKRYFSEFEKKSAQHASEFTATDDEVITAEEYAQQRDKYIQDGKGTPPA